MTYPCDWLHLSLLLFVTAAASALLGGSGARGSALGIGCGSPRSRAIFVHVFHLENDLERCMEHFVQSFFLLGRANHESLESVLARSFFNFGICDALTQFGWVARSLQLFAQVQFGANQDAGASSCGCFDLWDPLLTGVFQRVSLHQAEANDETICVCICNRAQTAKIFVTGCVPNLELHFAAFVVFRTVISVEHRRLVQTRENFLSPGHNDWRFPDSCVTHKHQLHVVLLVLIHKGFCLYHLQWR